MADIEMEIVLGVTRYTGTEEDGTPYEYFSSDTTILSPNHNFSQIQRNQLIRNMLGKHTHVKIIKTKVPQQKLPETEEI